MKVTPTTQPRHALRWVLGVGLVFVVVVGIALQVARRRADERWISMMLTWNEAWNQCDVMRTAMPPFDITAFGGPLLPETYLEFPPTRAYPFFSNTSGGSIFRSWRQSGGPCSFVVRQERAFFGFRMEARMTRREPALVDAVRGVLASVGVELLVKP